MWRRTDDDPHRRVLSTDWVCWWWPVLAPFCWWWCSHVAARCCSEGTDEMNEMSKNVLTLKSGSEVTQGHWKWYHSVDCYGFLLVFLSNFVPKTYRFWDIRLVSIQWPWNPGQGSLKVIENDTIQSGTHDFLLTFHSNRRPISNRFRDKWRFPSKIANFSDPYI